MVEIYCISHFNLIIYCEKVGNSNYIYINIYKRIDKEKNKFKRIIFMRELYCISYKPYLKRQ